MHADPVIARARKGMADLYRRMRADGRPDMALLLRDRVRSAMKAAGADLSEKLFSGGGLLG